MEELDLIKEMMIQEAHVFGVPSVLKKVFIVPYYDLRAFNHHFVSAKRFEIFHCLPYSVQRFCAKSRLHKITVKI